MKLSLSDAAEALGKSPRQIRYLIRSGRLPASKAGGRWVIDSDDLPLTAGQRADLAGRVDAARAAVERAVAPAATAADRKGRERRTYTVTDLEVFRIGREVLREVRALTPLDEDAAARLYAALEGVARGVHSFHPQDRSAGSRMPAMPPPTR